MKAMSLVNEPRTIHDACPYCNATPLQLRYSNIRDRLQFVPGEWSFFACPKCGSLRIFPFPSAELLARAYPPGYCFSADSLDGRRPSLFARFQQICFYTPIYGSQVRRIARHLPKITNDNCTLLDVGCGKADRLLAFRRLGYDVYGMDMVEENVRYIREHLGIPAVCGDAQQLSRYFSPETFDVVCAFALLEHLLDPAGFVQQCRTVVKPGGHLVLLVPLIDSLQGALFGRRWAAVTEVPRHVTIPSSFACRCLLNRNGYEPVTIIPDSLLSSGGVFGTTIFPKALSAFRSRPGHYVHRGLGICASAVGLAFSALERYLFQRPTGAVVLARKCG